jgi:predicted RND superfamily exporter protein
MPFDNLIINKEVEIYLEENIPSNEEIIEDEVIEKEKPKPNIKKDITNKVSSKKKINILASNDNKKIDEDNKLVINKDNTLSYNDKLNNSSKLKLNLYLYIYILLSVIVLIMIFKKFFIKY